MLTYANNNIGVVVANMIHRLELPMIIILFNTKVKVFSQSYTVEPSFLFSALFAFNFLVNNQVL